MLNKYPKFDQLAEKIASNKENLVSKKNIEEMFIEELEFEAKRIKQRKDNKTVLDTVYYRIVDWLNMDCEEIIKPVHLINYRITYLFFSRCKINL